MNIHVAEQFKRFLNDGHPTSGCPSPLILVEPRLPAFGSTIDYPVPVKTVKVTDANVVQVSDQQKEEPMIFLKWPIKKGLLPMASKRVPACLDGESTLPLIGESLPPIAEERRRVSLKEN